jgi:caspase domain-containing protein
LSSAPLPLSRDWVYLQIDRDSEEFARLKPGERGRDFLSGYTGDEFRVHGRDVIRFFAEKRALAPPDTNSMLAAYGDFVRHHAGSGQASWARRRMRELAAADPVNGGHEMASVPLSDVDSRIPHALTQRPDAVAVVIGNRGYSAYTPDVPDVEFALHDAAVMRRYLTSALGYLDGNVLYYEDATHATFRSVFGTRDVPQGRLAHLVKPGRSDVFVYYSGHGAPDLDTGEGYFVPVDCAPDDVRLNGYAAEILYTHLAQLGARTTTVVVDACFSGGSEGGMVITAASPVGIQVTAPAMSLPNGAVFASSAGDQISSWYPEMGHGLFTYLFLKGLQGAADGDGDRRITAGEMSAFLTDGNDGVPYWARRLHRGRKQTPRFHGDGTMTLIELAR